MKKLKYFTCGFALGLMAITAVHAAVPQRVTPPVRAIQAKKTESNSNFEQDYSKLTDLENRYAESWDQQQRLRKATQRVAGTSYAAPRSAQRAQQTKPTQKKRN